MTVNTCLLHWHKRNVHWPRLAYWITGQSKQLRKIKLKHLRESKQLARMNMSHNDTINYFISDGCVQIKFAGKLSICFFASNQNPDGILGEIVQYMWHVKQQAVQVQCTFLLCHWNKQLVIDCHWSNTHGAILYPNFVHFHAQNFIWWCFQIL